MTFFFPLFMLDIFIFHSLLLWSITILIFLGSFEFVLVLTKYFWTYIPRIFFFFLVKGLGFYIVKGFLGKYFGQACLVADKIWFLENE